MIISKIISVFYGFLEDSNSPSSTEKYIEIPDRGSCMYAKSDELEIECVMRFHQASEMTGFEKKKEYTKNLNGKRRIHACGRRGFTSLTQITKDTYICSLHFIDSVEGRKPRCDYPRKLKKVRQQESMPPKICL